MSIFGGHSCGHCGGPIVPVGMTGGTEASPQPLYACKGCGAQQTAPHLLPLMSGPVTGVADDGGPQHGQRLGVPFTSQRDLDMAEAAAQAQARQHNYVGGLRNG